MARARAVLIFERLWPVVVSMSALASLFVALSWFGLWAALPRALRPIGVLLFAVGFGVILWRAWRDRLPGRRDALDRLDRDSGAPHRPVSSREDALADTAADATTRALWALHRRRLDAALDRVALRAPSPRMVDRDRYALRAGAVLLTVAAAFVAGPEREGRLAAAFQWFPAVAPGAGFRLDSWIDPPAYTGRPPVVLSASGTSGATADEAPRAVAAPIGSIVVVRAAGDGRVDVAVEGGLAPAPAPEGVAPAKPAAGSAVVERRFRLGGDGRVTVRHGGAPAADYALTAIPDLPPTVTLQGAPVRNARGSMTLRYTLNDDYGVVGAEALLSDPTVDGKPVTGRILVPPPKVPLALPAAPRGLGAGETTADLADSPWAGTTVTMVLIARDEGGNTGRSAPVSVVLPARSFSRPLARALVEQRRDLVFDPDHREAIDTALDALTLAPDLFETPPAIFLGLRTAKSRLDAARTDEDLVGVADLLWSMALQIEEGDLSRTEADLKALQQELKDALARNAPPEEVKRLTEALRKQLDKFLAEMAQKADPTPRADSRGPDDGARSVTPGQLQKMIDRMEEAAKNGDLAEAQRLLDQLRGVLDNLKTAERRSGAQQRAQQQMNRAMNDLDRMTRDQQALRDQTFKQGREERKADREQDGDEQDAQGDRPPEADDPSQDGQQAQGRQAPGEQAQGEDGQGEQTAPGQGDGGRQGQSGKGQPGKGQAGKGQVGKGQAGAGGDLQGRQNALRQKLGQLQKQMRDLGLEGEKGFEDAAKAMKQAEQALGRGRDGGDEAVGAQGRALADLKKGADGLQKQMAQGQGEGQGQAQGDSPEGEGPDGQTGGANGQRLDPLGRPPRSKGASSADGNGGIEGSAGARARQVLEELRRRLGDPSRPMAEQDYLERLLKRY